MSKQKQVEIQQASTHTQAKPVEQAVAMEETAVSPYPALQRAYADPSDITPNDTKVLQRTFGNQAMQRFAIQRKMTLGPVGDKYEQEADAVAKQVMQTINTPKAPPVQRQEEDDALQMKPSPSAMPLPTISTLQRQQEDDELQLKPSGLKPFQSNLPPFPFLQRQEEDDELQMKGGSTLEGGELSGDIERSVQSAKSGGQPLGDDVRGSMEQAFNADFSGVKIHTGGNADSLNRSISARAFTSGSDVFFRSGEYNPDSSGGKELLAHELTHTIQQGQSVQRSESAKHDDISVNSPVQSVSTTQRMADTIQRAVGLEIEIPIPVDNLSSDDVKQLQVLIAEAEVANQLKESKGREVSETKKKIDKEEKKHSWFKNSANLKQWGIDYDKLVLEMQKAGFDESGKRVEIGTIIGTKGRAQYGTAKQFNTFRVDVDHDDRVKGGDWPPREAGGDSLMEIVMDPAETKADFNASLDIISAFLSNVMSNTAQLTKRWAPGGYDKMAGIGPLDHPFFPMSSKKDRHNQQGSVQANVGIDLRKYNEMLQWYATDKVSLAPEDAGEGSKKMYHQIRVDMAKAAKLAREITAEFRDTIATSFEKESAGNFAGFQGWVTHMAMYLQRGATKGLRGNAKNVVPVLLKTPNDIVVHYGMTDTEKQFFNTYKDSIITLILKAVGRGDDVGKPLTNLLDFTE